MSSLAQVTMSADFARASLVSSLDLSLSWTSLSIVVQTYFALCDQPEGLASWQNDLTANLEWSPFDNGSL